MHSSPTRTTQQHTLARSTGTTHPLAARLSNRIKFSRKPSPLPPTSNPFTRPHSLNITKPAAPQDSISPPAGAVLRAAGEPILSWTIYTLRRPRCTHPCKQLLGRHAPAPPRRPSVDFYLPCLLRCTASFAASWPFASAQRTAGSRARSGPSGSLASPLHRCGRTLATQGVAVVHTVSTEWGGGVLIGVHTTA